MGTNYKHLSCEERTMIQLSLEQGCTLRAIARSVQRAPSSINRELKRNGWHIPAAAPKKRGRPPVAGRVSCTARATARRCAGEDHHAHPGMRFDAVEHAAEVGREIQAHGIDAIRPVQSERGDPVLDIQSELAFAHGSSENVFSQN
jgi:transposase-like protein